MTKPYKPRERTSVRHVAYLRFTREQYERLCKDRIVEGKSIPSLLTDRYFKGEPIQPVFGAAETNALLSQLSYYGRNLNQITKHMHSGLTNSVVNEFQGLMRIVTKLFQTVLDSYGNR
jgi:hypothetical protein